MVKNPIEQLCNIYNLSEKDLFDRFQLCFFRNGILWFTDNFKNQWGDDWNDSYWECNAEPPYEIYDETLKNEHRGHLIKVGVDLVGNFSVRTLEDSNISVEEINAGASPWISITKYVSGSEHGRFYNVYGGDTLGCVLKTLEDAEVDCGVFAKNFTMKV